MNKTRVEYVVAVVVVSIVVGSVYACLAYGLFVALGESIR